MTAIFRAPVTTFSPFEDATREAIDALLMAGDNHGCLRLDLFVASIDSMRIIKDGVTYFELDPEGWARPYNTQNFPSHLKGKFLEVLWRVNEDAGIAEMVGGYPLPWDDGMFTDSMQERHLSILLLKDGVGAVIQEYIPNWLNESAPDNYTSASAEAKVRAEIMSVFTDSKPGNHTRLRAAQHISQQQKMLSAMFDHHLDNEEDITLGNVDPEDRI